MLSGTLLPAHPQPLEDELFSSWLVRVAKANGQKLHTFSRMVLGEVSIWNRDIDKSVTGGSLAALAMRTGTTIQRAEQTSLAAFEGRLYEKHNPGGMTPWILPAGIYHRVRRRYGLQFCPQCLAEDIEPYFRRAWRIALYTACPQHRCRLLDCCPECGAAVMFHRRDFLDKENPDRGPMANCHACGFNLAFAPHVPSEDSVVNFLHSTTEVLSHGWIDLPQFGTVYSFLYFSGVRHLMKLVAIDKKCAEQFKSIGLSNGNSGNSAGRGIEYLDIFSRYEALRNVIELLRDWPIAFVQASRNANLHMTYLMKDFENAPWWYAAPVRWNLLHAGYQTNEQEIASVVLWVRANGLRVSAQRVSQMLGVSDSKLVTKMLAR